MKEILRPSPEVARIVHSVLTSRRSVRSYSSHPISDEDLKLILEAAIHAPSGSNTQNQRFLVITDQEEKLAIGTHRFVWPYRGANQEKMRRLKPGGILANAASLILVFADAAINDSRGIGEYYLWESLEIQNCAASIENMLNMATALGIGSCWVSASEAMSRTRMLSGRSWSQVLARYAIPQTYKIQGIVLLGHPKASDSNGYPEGEVMHGATYWNETARKPVEDYLIQHRSAGLDPVPSLSGAEKLLLATLSRTLRILLGCVKAADRAVHKLEVETALRELHARLQSAPHKSDRVQ